MQPFVPSCRALVGQFLPCDVRSFKYRIYDDQPTVSALGFVIDPKSRF